jgi:light-regulated signal transduction histidine kinase (bacteriophytochrome)
VEIKRGLAPPWNNEARMVALRLRGALIALL